MTTITIELPANLYKRLQTEAAQRGQPPEEIAQAWVTERLVPYHPDAPPPAPPGERERAIAMMRTTGLLAELSPEEKVLAAQSTLTLEEACAILDRVGGQPLSEVVLEMRGPKERVISSWIPAHSLTRHKWSPMNTLSF